MATTYNETITTGTIKADDIDDAGGGSIDVATRVNFGPSGPVGVVAAFGATGSQSNFESDGDLIMDNDAGILLGNGTGGLSTVGSELVISGDTGNFTLAGGEQMLVHGVPKIRSITVPYTDFTAAATTDFTDYTVEATYDWILLDWFARQTADFTGGTLSAVEMTLGDSTSPTGYLPASQVDLFSGAPAFHGEPASDRGTYISTFGTHKLQTNNIIRVTLNTTGDNCSALTAGSLTLYVRYFTVPN